MELNDKIKDIARYIKVKHILNKLKTDKDTVKVYIKNFFKNEDEFNICYRELSEFSFHNLDGFLYKTDCYFYYYKSTEYNKSNEIIKNYTKEVNDLKNKLKVK